MSTIESDTESETSTEKTDQSTDGKLTLDVSDDAPLDTGEVVLDMPWDDTAELITDAIDRVDGLGEETVDAALDYYTSSDGLGLGRWTAAHDGELIRGTSGGKFRETHHDGLPGVGNARADALLDARDEVLPEHPLVDWLNDHPDVGVYLTIEKQNPGPMTSKQQFPDHMSFTNMNRYGYRSITGEDTDHDLTVRRDGEWVELDDPFEGLTRSLGSNTHSVGPPQRVSRWAYEFLHYDFVAPTVVPTDAHWFTGGDGDE